MSDPALTLNDAIAAYQAGQLEQAEHLCRQILAAQADLFDAIHLLASVQLARGKKAAALASYDRAIALRPDHAETHYNRGVALHESQRLPEALAAYERAIALKPDLAEAHNNAGNALSSLDRHDEALTSYGRALGLRPDFVEAINNRGVTLYDLRRFGEALADHERALALRPDNPKTLNNRANALHALKRHDEALTDYERAVALQPDYAEAHWNCALARLRLGDFHGGWPGYEWGWKAGHRGTERRFAQPRWTGTEPLNGKTLLLHAEQGLGDTIQFARYALLAADAGATVMIEAPPSLASLLSEIPNVRPVISRGSPLPAFDLHCPLLSLPLAFGTRLDTIPARVPYLNAPRARLTRWKARIPRAQGLRVGLAWSGRDRPDPHRSLALAQLAPLFDLPGVRFVSLQPETRPGDEPSLRGRHGLLHFGPSLSDFADTAAVIAQLDLVISVDTAVAHLAGALGKPVWILLPFLSDWRWLLDRDDSPWYPTARLFRQNKAGAWDAVVGRVREALGEFARGDAVTR
jgi:tetratricopeptide (TPR) repeat protein